MRSPATATVAARYIVAGESSKCHLRSSATVTGRLRTSTVTSERSCKWLRERASARGAPHPKEGPSDAVHHSSAFVLQVISHDAYSERDPIGMAQNRRSEQRPTRSKSDEPPVTTAMVAAHFKVHERTIRRWMERGLPFEQPYEHGSVRFRIVDCEAWVTRHRGDRAASRACERPARATGDPAPPTGPASVPEPPAKPAASLPLQAIEPWVAIAAAAAHLACSEAHIEFLTTLDSDDQIPHRREGDRLLFKLSQIDAWLDRGATSR